jgi:exodeoxyribonuclease VII large subunit
MDKPSFIFTVKQLTRYIRTVLEREKALQALWVRGEITDLTRHSSGHFYFSLKDDAGRLRCVMFRSAAVKLSFRPEEGMTVVAYGHISLYEPSGQYQLLVEELTAEGLGALYLAFEALKRKLAAEGLFDVARKRPLPRFPRRIAVITSADGAAVHDIITVIRRRWKPASLLVIPTLVQGPGAVEAVVRSLGLAASIPDIDMAIVTRGGGSPEELAVFNAEEIARAIIACPVPVVSAVGHEVDFTIADFVADLRAPTPSVAGELVVPDGAQVRAHLGHLLARMSATLERRLDRAHRELSLLRMQRPFRYPQEIVEVRAQRVDVASERLQDAVVEILSDGSARLGIAVGRLEALSPIAVMKRGYAVVRKLPEGDLVRSAAQLVGGDNATIIFADGQTPVTVEKPQPQKTLGL